jgi:hypothetical protein
LILFNKRRPQKNTHIAARAVAGQRSHSKAKTRQKP